MRCPRELARLPQVHSELTEGGPVYTRLAEWGRCQASLSRRNPRLALRGRFGRAVSQAPEPSTATRATPHLQERPLREGSQKCAECLAARTPRRALEVSLG